MPTAYITAPEDAADDLAAILVRERLAACVNLVNCRSVYRWEGDIVEDREVILLAKTTDERYADLTERIVEEHPHDVPCIERFEDEPIEHSRRGELKVSADPRSVPPSQATARLILLDR